VPQCAAQSKTLEVDLDKCDSSGNLKIVFVLFEQNLASNTLDLLSPKGRCQKLDTELLINPENIFLREIEVLG
jgi:hypothetical protein